MKKKHDGDCWIYAVKICTCGYLHQLSIDPDSEEYRNRADEIAEHENRLHQLNQHD